MRRGSPILARISRWEQYDSGETTTGLWNGHRTKDDLAPFNRGFAARRARTAAGAESRKYRERRTRCTGHVPDASRYGTMANPVAGLRNRSIGQRNILAAQLHFAATALETSRKTLRSLLSAVLESRGCQADLTEDRLGGQNSWASRQVTFRCHDSLAPAANWTIGPSGGK